jgi:hypothetical protein
VITILFLLDDELFYWIFIPGGGAVGCLMAVE